MVWRGSRQGHRDNPNKAIRVHGTLGARVPVKKGTVAAILVPLFTARTLKAHERASRQS